MMAVPGFQQFLLPLLKTSSDQQEHRLVEAIIEVADMADLNEEQRSELLPSGLQTKLHNRVSWCCT
jgi:restriction system protein